MVVFADRVESEAPLRRRCLVVALLTWSAGAFGCSKTVEEELELRSRTASNREAEPADSTEPTGDVKVMRAMMSSFAFASDQPWEQPGEVDFDDPRTRPFGVEVDNQCSDAVYLFFGQEPRPDSNYYTTLNGDSQSYSLMMPGDRVWIIDERQRPVDAATVDVDTTSVIIEENCRSIISA